jgi:SEC-C motif-containing protein
MTLCPCGSQKYFAECCSPYLEMKQHPETPEQLMRSRYTAYSLADIGYIQNTMRGKALVGFNPNEAKAWTQNVTWVGLKVLRSFLETPEKAFVEFIAQYREQNQLKKIQELSEFHKEGALWFYVDGVHEKNQEKKQKVSRNAPCPCGSGKKFKNCHDK